MLKIFGFLLKILQGRLTFPADQPELTNSLLCPRFLLVRSLSCLAFLQVSAGNPNSREYRDGAHETRQLDLGVTSKTQPVS